MFYIKGEIQSKVKIQSLPSHPPAYVKLGEVL